MHSHLFAKTMCGLGLDPRPNAFLDRLPGTTLATVNLMSALGLRRARRGAIVGHLAMFEMTSSRPNRGYGNGLRRLGADRETTDFFDEHVEADAVHENIAAYDLAGGLARMEPDLAADILFGARALLLLEARFAGPAAAVLGAGTKLAAQRGRHATAQRSRLTVEPFSYIVPLRWTVPGPIDGLAAYLGTVAGWADEVIVVDDSPAELFAAHAGALPAEVRHLHPDPGRSSPNGKVDGIITGVERPGTSGS